MHPCKGKVEIEVKNELEEEVKKMNESVEKKEERKKERKARRRVAEVCLLFIACVQRREGKGNEYSCACVCV